MIQIRVASNIGFCCGVKRAVDIAFKALEDGKRKLYSLGRIIHNPQMTEKLTESGLEVVSDLNNIKEGRFLVRSHGVHPDLIKELASRGIEIIDATCPFVKSTQYLISELREEGYKIIIVGEKEHPEVKSLIGYAESQAMVISEPGEVREDSFNRSHRWAVVAQSTQSQRNFQEVISRLLRENLSELRIFFTICQETLKRESLTRDLAGTCDLIIVVGGFDSANTRRLKEMASSFEAVSYQVENAAQINKDWLKGLGSVGIVSGTSTPEWVVNEIVKKINEEMCCGTAKVT
ncbi:MAG: 4-hydroxy-3-methylbut-2-enyl diphosphate reductase [Candidatus Omnitrophica bacterium]|nr:4-hydroxy-3-methylbut-2-enyl diphosphate reductase [Candidatus Omnitrophota bacterium]